MQEGYRALRQEVDTALANCNTAWEHEIDLQIPAKVSVTFHDTFKEQLRTDSRSCQRHTSRRSGMNSGGQFLACVSVPLRDAPEGNPPNCSQRENWDLDFPCQ